VSVEKRGDRSEGMALTEALMFVPGIVEAAGRHHPGNVKSALISPPGRSR
jgi:hypothetical protein